APCLWLHNTTPRQSVLAMVYFSCRQEHLWQIEEQETNYRLEQEEPEPLEIKEEPEEPGAPQRKEEPEEPGFLQFPEDQEEPGTLEIEEHEDLGSSQTGARPVVTSESETLKVPSVEEQSDLISEKQAGCEETCSEPVRKKTKPCQKVRTVTDKKKTCETCGKSFICQSHLLNHIRVHTGEKPYSCETCGKSFSMQGNLLYHMRSHTDEKPYCCETCGKSFSIQRNLSRHMRIHTGEKPYSCQTCGKSFISQTHLVRHIRTHTGEKPYSCETCGKSFTQRDALLRHMRIHRDEKPYSCGTCGKSFICQSTLLCHIRTHTGEKPYSCGSCGKSFSIQRNLSRHMKTHTEGSNEYTPGCRLIAMEKCRKTIMEFFKTKPTNTKVKEGLAVCEDVELSYCVLQLVMAHFSENITGLVLLIDVSFLFLYTYHTTCHTMTSYNITICVSLSVSEGSATTADIERTTNIPETPHLSPSNYALKLLCNKKNVAVIRLSSLN
uniref:C2H2-type domain-containing protein n=1 Tax=Salarias fasciatus TaxID=181472 RepID=A0A672FQ71_SALFA